MHSSGIDRKVLVKAAGQHHRPLDETCDLFKQTGILDQFQTQRQRTVLGIVQDDVLAPVRIQDNLVLFQTGRIVIEAPDLKGFVRQKPVAAGVCPELIPSNSNGTTSGSSVSGPNVATMECSGRTQRVAVVPQRMDFGQGNARRMPGMNSAMISIADRPGFSITAT